MLIAWVAVALMAGVVGIIIAKAKGVSDGTGFWLGLLLGPIGWLIVALGKPKDQAN